MTELYILEKHDELLPIWRAARDRWLNVLHVDFHDDMRGFVIDRRRGAMYRSCFAAANDSLPDEGNFLGHAVAEGIIRKLHWVHPRLGGRVYDSYVVRYVSDWSAIPDRLSHRLRSDQEFAIDFRESVYEEWNGTSDEIQLSVDWDFFAARQYAASGFLETFDGFLAKIERASITRVGFCYSPAYVHPSKDQFTQAVERLAKRCRCAPIWPNGDFRRGLPEVPIEPRRDGFKWRLIRFLRHRGIF